VTLGGYISAAHPGTVIHNLDLLNNATSTLSLFAQVPIIAEYLEGLNRESPDGYVLICHSQGAAICRTVLEYMDTNACDTFISLAGPLMGVYGIPKGWTFIPEWIHKTAKDLLYKVFYTTELQDTLSLGGWLKYIYGLGSFLFCDLCLRVWVCGCVGVCVGAPHTH
jgi:hypothetical protein